MKSVDSVPMSPARLAPAARSAHGRSIRGLEAGAMPGIGYGRFGRMFAFAGNIVPDECLRAIAGAMIKPDVSKPIDTPEPVDENPCIPAGYTYFGQFIDHDITFDPTDIKAKAVDVAALEDFRTPALDLDCVYGRGPDDQPFMYDKGQHLRLGGPLTAGDSTVGSSRDLLRLTIPDEPNQWAIIGDKRNDENRIVSQFQAMFIAFHNKVIDTPALIAEAGGIWDDPESRFRTAVDIVRWHYQWLVINDFVKRVTEPGTLFDLLDADGTTHLPLYDKPEARYAYIPVEFAGAAYRFGHSMVRPGYSLNSDVVKRAGASSGDARIPIFSESRDARDNLNGFGVAMPEDWGIDWAFFLDRVPKGPEHRGYQVPQPSYRLDAQLVPPLTALPEFAGAVSPFNQLAYRNLLRGVANLRLPSGEQVARALGIVPLSPDILWSAGSNALDPDALSDDEREELRATSERRAVVADRWVRGGGANGSALRGNTPLWYYVLREAEYYGTTAMAEGPTIGFGGQHLGPVGSRIVAETFLGLLARDPSSYLRRWPQFRPMAPVATDPDTFTLGDLVTWALTPGDAADVRKGLD